MPLDKEFVNSLFDDLEGKFTPQDTKTPEQSYTPQQEEVVPQPAPSVVPDDSFTSIPDDLDSMLGIDTEVNVQEEAKEDNPTEDIAKKLKANREVKTVGQQEGRSWSEIASMDSDIAKENAYWKSALAQGIITQEQYDEEAKNGVTNQLLAFGQQTTKATMAIGNFVLETGHWVGDNATKLASWMGSETAKEWNDKYYKDTDITPDFIKQTIKEANEWEDTHTKDENGETLWINSGLSMIYGVIPEVALIEAQVAKSLVSIAQKGNSIAKVYKKGGLVTERVSGKVRVGSEMVAGATAGYITSYGEHEDTLKAVASGAINAAAVLGFEGIVHVAKRNVNVTSQGAMKKVARALYDEAKLTNPDGLANKIKEFETMNSDGKKFKNLSYEEQLFITSSQSAQGRRLMTRMLKDGDKETLDKYNKIKANLYNSMEKVTEEGLEVLQTKGVKTINAGGEEVASNTFFKWFSEAGGFADRDNFEVFSRILAGKDANVENMASAYRTKKDIWLDMNSNLFRAGDKGIEPMNYKLEINADATGENLANYMKSKVQGAESDFPAPIMSEFGSELTKLIKLQVGKGWRDGDLFQLTPADMLNIMEEFKRTDLYTKHMESGNIFSKQADEFLVDMFTKATNPQLGKVLKEISEMDRAFQQALQNPNTALNLLKTGHMAMDESAAKASVKALSTLNKDTYNKIVKALPYEQQVKVELAIGRVLSMKARNPKGVNDIDLSVASKDAELGAGEFENWSPVTNEGDSFKAQRDYFIDTLSFKLKAPEIGSGEITASTEIGRIKNSLILGIWGRIQTKGSVLNNHYYSVKQMDKIFKALSDDVLTFNPNPNISKITDGSEEFMTAKGAMELMSKASKFMDIDALDMDGLDLVLMPNNIKAQSTVLLTPVTKDVITKGGYSAMAEIKQSLTVDPETGITTMDYATGEKFRPLADSNILTNEWSKMNKRVNGHGIVVAPDGRAKFLIDSKKTQPKQLWSKVEPNKTYNLNQLWTQSSIKELQKSLPSLDIGNIQIKVVNDKALDSDGGFNRITNVITINKANLKTWEEGAKTLNHELQHLVSKKFGMPRGSNTKLAQDKAVAQIGKATKNALNMHTLDSTQRNYVYNMLMALSDLKAGSLTANSKSLKAFENDRVKYFETVNKTGLFKKYLDKDTPADLKTLEDAEKFLDNILTKLSKKKGGKPIVSGDTLKSLKEDYGTYAMYLKTLGEVEARFVTEVARSLKLGLDNKSLALFHEKHQDALNQVLFSADTLKKDILYFSDGTKKFAPK